MQKIKLFQRFIYTTSIITITILVNSTMADNVSTYNELKTAVGNSSVSTITFLNDIELSSNLQGIAVPNLTINGNNHTLSGNFSGFKLWDNKSSSIYEINNLNFNNLNFNGPGAAIYLNNLNQNSKLIINNGNFTDNNATSIYIGVGGAVYNNAGNISFNEVSNFTNNSAERSGGAIYNIGSLGFNGVANFIDNRADGKSGGAIANIGDMIFDNTSSFTNNRAALYGGAIYNAGNLNFNANTIFTENTANAINGRGGAVYNAGALKFSGAANFMNNSAYEGGAIYNTNTSNINFNGNANFFGNTDSTGLNDIHNDGIININAGITTLGGGMTGTGVLNVSDAMLNLGTSNITQGAVNFASNSILAIEYTDSTTTRIATTESPTIDAGAKIIVNKAGDYKLFNSSPVSGNIFFNPNLMYDVTDTQGLYTFTIKSAAQIIDAIKANTGIILNTNDTSALISLNNLNYDVANRKVIDIFEGVQASDTASLNQVKYLAYSSASIIQSIATGSQNSIIDITGRRTSLINDNKLGLAPWAQLIYNHKKQNTTGDNPGFYSNARGIAIGLDKTTTDYIVGFGYAYNDTNLSSNGTDINADGHNIFTYAHYKLENWFVNGVINAEFSGYQDENPLRSAKHQVNAYGGQVLTGYDFFGLKPETGIRYIYINTGNYTDSIGTNFNLSNINVLTGVLGGVYNKEFTGKNNKYTITPEIKLGATYDFVSSDNNGMITILDAANSYNAITNKLPRFGAEAGIGLTLHVKQFYITLNYDTFIRKDYLSQTGMLKLKCEL